MTQPAQIHQTHQRAGHWSSSLGFILATIGAAVGLGNIWMFPYFVGAHGGAAFVLIYLLCIFLIGMPIMMAEAAIGQRGQQNPIDALKVLARQAHASRWWPLVSYWGALALLLILSFYSVVSGWSIAYLLKTVQSTFVNASAEEVGQIFGAFLSSPWQLLLWHTVFMIMTMGVLVFGVQKGLERACKIMMPGLAVILLILIGYGILQAEFMQAVYFLFYPDFSQINAQVILAAMGIAFFTLALGAGCIVAYASYMPEDKKLTRHIGVIAGFDTLLALMAGLAIFPFVFAYGLSPAEGPGLMFEVLPTAFAQMPAGQLLGGLFFTLLIFAAWTASLSLAEPLIAIVSERTRFNRAQAITLIGLVAWSLGILALLSFNVFAETKLLGRFTFFDIATEVPTKIILPLGGLGFALFAGWVMKKSEVQQALHLSDKAFAIWRFLIRYLAPVAILAVFISQLI